MRDSLPRFLAQFSEISDPRSEANCRAFTSTTIENKERTQNPEKLICEGHRGENEKVADKDPKMWASIGVSSPPS